MGVVFWAHQKYLSPPPSASMSPEMEQQQKIMKIMFPLMMPIFMYAAPSGLTIYFITNSTLGILENKHIRHNAEKKGLLDPEKIKAEKAAKRAARGDKPAKTGGFMAKLQALAEQQQQVQQQKAGKAKKVQNTARKPEPKDRNYKKRK
jgi:YidC/Oxa1 family membrane protein insertase